jgi:hypothetical protein
MNLLDEFIGIVKALGAAGIRYAVVGGVAMALHDRPRFTRDIDLLIHPDDAARAAAALEPLGYFEASEPWTFASTQLTLHRYVKTQGEDHLVVDILIGAQPRHSQILDAATDQPWSEGTVRVIRKEDLIWMKQQRGSDQDNVDIRKLEDDQT